MENSRKPFVIFFLVFVYILSFSVWWTILLFNKNQQAYDAQIEVYELQEKYDEIAILKQKAKRQKLMIITEGLVFLSLLCVGFYIVARSISRELQVARQQKNFILSITHELKSPLASIKLVLDTLRQRELPKEKTTKLLSNAGGDVDRLGQLVDNILLAAKMEDARYVFARDSINFSEYIRQFKQKITQKEFSTEVIHVDKTIEDDLHIIGDKDALNSVLVNLVENAVKYRDDGLQLGIGLYKKEGKAVLEVSDNGLGIPNNEKEAVFRKFYRVGNEETRKAKGTGLGLYIVKHIVEQHGGKATVLDNTPKGSIFKISIPTVN